MTTIIKEESDTENTTIEKITKATTIKSISITIEFNSNKHHTINLCVVHQNTILYNKWSQQQEQQQQEQVLQR